MSERREWKCDACGDTFVSGGRRVSVEFLIQPGSQTSGEYAYAGAHWSEPQPRVDLCPRCIDGGVRLNGHAEVDFKTVPSKVPA